jgi:hypothetical protein
VGSLFWPGLLIIGLSVCVILGFRWAIIGVSARYAALGAWLIVGSILAVPFPWLLLNVGLGLACICPVGLLIRAAIAQPSTESTKTEEEETGISN